MQVYWPLERQHVVAKAISAMRQQASASCYADSIAGTLAVRPGPISLCGAAPWRVVRGTLCSPTPTMTQPGCQHAVPVQFRFLCPSGCGHIACTPGKPARGSSGKWPMFVCPACHKSARLGSAVCDSCGRRLYACTCVPRPCPQPGIGTRPVQLDLGRFFMRPAP